MLRDGFGFLLLVLTTSCLALLYFHMIFKIIIFFSNLELARDALHRTGRYKVRQGVFSPAHDGYGKEVSVRVRVCSQLLYQDLLSLHCQPALNLVCVFFSGPVCARLCLKPDTVKQT